MKRTPLKRSPMRPTRMKRGRPSDELKEKMLQFKWSVSGQACAGCGKFSYCFSHHCVYRQHLKVEDAWREENALPLCGDCHEAHHNRSRVLPLNALTETNLAFAQEVLGEAAPDYLSRYYSKEAGQ